VKAETKLRVSNNTANVALSTEITAMSRKNLKYRVLTVLERRTRILPLINIVENRNTEGKVFLKK
jgi:hypothetical protein